MLIIKVDKKDISENIIKKTFQLNIASYVKSLFKNDKINIIDDSKTLELITSESSEKNEGNATIELTFKKTITINNLDSIDNHSLDKIVSEVKNFCDQAVKINNYVYLPLNMRDKKNADTRTSTTGNRI
jgi:hypothetical protein